MTIGGRSRIATRTKRRPLGARSPLGATVVVEYCESFPNDGVFDLTAEDQTWQIPSTGAGVVTSGVLQTVSGFADGRMEVDAGDADMFVEATFSTGVDNVYLVARCGDTGDLYGDQGIYLYLDPSGGSTYIDLGDWTGGSVADDTPAVSIDATWRLEVIGNTARCLRNGVEMLTGDITGIVTSGQRGGFNLTSTSSAVFTPTTVTESFNKANSSTIGPDLTWNKTSFVNGFAYTGDGVVFSNKYALQGHDGMFGGSDDDYAECEITVNGLTFVDTVDAYVQARVGAVSTIGTGSNQVAASTFQLRMRGSSSTYMAAFTTDSGGQINLSGFGSDIQSASFGAGDLLGLVYDESANELHAQINGSTVATISASGMGTISPAIALEVTCVAPNGPGAFGADHQDTFDEFEASGTVQSTVYPGGMDAFCVGPAS